MLKPKLKTFAYTICNVIFCGGQNSNDRHHVTWCHARYCKVMRKTLQRWRLLQVLAQCGKSASTTRSSSDACFTQERLPAGSSSLRLTASMRCNKCPPSLVQSCSHGHGLYTVTEPTPLRRNIAFRMPVLLGNVTGHVGRAPTAPNAMSCSELRRHHC